jgi:hypothetical protein
MLDVCRLAPRMSSRSWEGPASQRRYYRGMLDARQEISKATVWPRGPMVWRASVLLLGAGGLALGRVVVMVVVVVVRRVVSTNLSQLGQLNVALLLGCHSLAYPLPAPPPLLLCVAAQPLALLLVPRAEGLAAEHEIFILDDGRLHPRVSAELDLARCRVVGPQVRDDVVG